MLKSFIDVVVLTLSLYGSEQSIKETMLQLYKSNFYTI